MSQVMRAILFPGQGAQFKGMGKDLFALYPDFVSIASTLLGYDLEELCLYDPENKLSQTQYTQPALYTVNALAWSYDERYIPEMLSDQITHPVLWRDSIRNLLGQHSEMEFQEIGSKILSKVVKQIKEKDVPLNPGPSTYKRAEETYR